eukprot:1561987-Prymnesium_polylepis.1
MENGSKRKMSAPATSIRVNLSPSANGTNGVHHAGERSSAEQSRSRKSRIAEIPPFCAPPAAPSQQPNGVAAHHEPPDVPKEEERRTLSSPAFRVSDCQPAALPCELQNGELPKAKSHAELAARQSGAYESNG